MKRLDMVLELANFLLLEAPIAMTEAEAQDLANKTILLLELKGMNPPFKLKHISREWVQTNQITQLALDSILKEFKWEDGNGEKT